MIRVLVECVSLLTTMHMVAVAVHDSTRPWWWLPLAGLCLGIFMVAARIPGEDDR